MSKTLNQRLYDFMEEMDGVEILKTTEAYGYYYAALPDILKVIHPVLRKHGIWYQHTVSYSEITKRNIVRTIVYNIDDSNDFIVAETLVDGDAKLAKMNQFMVEGSAMTYYRRYQLSVLLALNIDEDTDAGGKRVRGGGRSPEAAAKKSEAPEMIEIFKNQMEKKNKAQMLKLLDVYKPQLSNEEIKEIDKLIKDKYDN